MDIIEYIKSNLENTSLDKIANFLNLHRRTLNKIIKDNNIVDERTYRKCSFCNEIVFHKNVKNRIRCENDDKKCYKCISLIKKDIYKGDGNPFYGKRHTEENKIRYRSIHKGKRYSKETEFKKGHHNPDQKTNYEYWIIKYGKIEADKRNEIFKKKISILNSGKLNPMYGKPAPVGSGNGWSGWYKNWYFRSLLELSYMIFIIERFNLAWENGENRKNKMTYFINGICRNYFPDFIINNKYVIECKPKKLWNTEINILKYEFGKIQCEEKGYILKRVDCSKIKKKELIQLYLNDDVKFTKKYEDRIKSIISKDL